MSDLKDTKKRIRQREFLNKFIDRPTEFFIRHNISPETLSYLGFICSLIAAFLIAIGMVHFPFWFSWPVPFLMFWSGAFDIFDGEVARRTGKESKSGAYLDSNLDRLSDIIIIFGLIYSELVDFLLGFIVIFLVIMISYTRSRAEKEGANMKGVGIMERAERILILIIAISIESWVFYLTNLIIGRPWPWFFLIFMYLFTLSLAITLFQRIIFSFKKLRKLKNKEKESN
ncbi:MAG: CDP-alcohol phosphatidyltransferase family protein [Promethearchaeota archaeon]